MSNFNFTSPVSGAAQTGFTSPTYTLTQDQSPSPNADQYAVTALGGTQVGVDTHTASNPFTIARFMPKSVNSLGLPDVNGNYRSIPTTRYKFVVRKGCTLSNGQRKPVVVRFELEIPAGADEDDPEALRAAVSLALGAWYAESAGLGTMLVTGLK